VLIDRERFKAGISLLGQMDDVQDHASASVLVLSPEYLKSRNCLHEMRRAIARDPGFEKGIVVPIERVRCSMPGGIARSGPLYVKLTDEKDSAAWKRLLDACEADLGASAPHWLQARDQVVRLLKRRQSVNLLVQGKPRWRALVSDVQENHIPDLAVVDLNSGVTETREGVVAEILQICGVGGNEPRKRMDLAALQGAFDSKSSIHRLALLHFDRVLHRRYGPDFFAALRYLVTEAHKLVLLLESRRPFSDLLDSADPSSAALCQTVELKGELV
jgi:hypothetical protein